MIGLRGLIEWIPDRQAASLLEAMYPMARFTPRLPQFRDGSPGLRSGYTTADANRRETVMAEESAFVIGASASCSDGVCGVVRRIIIDPDNRTVTHLVIEPRHRLQPGRLVPVDLVDSTTGEIRLHCTIAEFDQLEPAEEARLVEGRGLGISTLAGGPPLGIPVPTPVVVEDAIPVGETEVSPGDPVHALDGEIGQVQGSSSIRTTAA